MCEISTGSVSEICHIRSLADDLKNLMDSGEFTDITIVVEEHRFSCHKAILACRSNYFKALFFNGMKESQSSSEIRLHGIKSQAFDRLLTYTYSGGLDLVLFSQDEIIDLLAVAHQYCFELLQEAICKYLASILNGKNACDIFEIAGLYEIPSLRQQCLQFADANAEDVLKSDGFLTLSKSSLVDLLSRDSFFTQEIVIFNSVAQWLNANPEIDKEDVIPCIRLHLINRRDLLLVVRETKLISPEIILDTIQDIDVNNYLESTPRGYSVQDNNVAAKSLGATILAENQRDPSEISISYDWQNGIGYHDIDLKDDHGGVLITLGREYIVNMIRMLLMDKESPSNSYYIKVSTDNINWKEIIDYRGYYCRSWQHLMFHPTVVRYIRVIGSRNIINRRFCVMSFECYLNKLSWPIREYMNGLMVPNTNIAVHDKGAALIQGVNRSNNKFLSGAFSEDYDWDCGYVCHQINGCPCGIVIQLGQPYLINSLRFLLWDLDDRWYSYYVEISVNQEDWIRIKDQKGSQCRSWQELQFDTKPVSFIKIVGTKNSVNDVFHCTYFECPSQASNNNITNAD
ncbi:BTB/POZ domain-containing protein 9 [Trichoplax sp. H2]|nr:BTB/POZ domain-containing protein 9 [Trichoplax sp. H2]|eukprot:RDD47702.1 BTB/POZ domain-containing protein 9 [Trichoplax sp. H2]